MDIEPTTLTRGIHAVWDTNNIAIIVLFLVAVAEAALIYVLLNGLLKTKDVMASLEKSISILNERIKHD